MVGHVTADGYTELGIGLISVGWMGKLHSRAYQAIAMVYPELKIRTRLIHAADSAPDRADAREFGDVENDDYAGALVRFAADSPGGGVAGTLEASRVIVGPQCGLGLEIYGTEGSASWKLRADERAAALDRTHRAEPGLHHRPGQRLEGRLRPLPARPRQRHGVRRPQGHRGKEVPRRRDRWRAAQLHHRRGSG